MIKKNTKQKQIVRTLIYIGLTLVTAWFIYTVYKRQEFAIEPFADINNTKTYGNIISDMSGLKSAKTYTEATKQIIRLPGRFKLTGFRVNGVILGQVTVSNTTVWLFTQSPVVLFNDITESDIQPITIDKKPYYAFKDNATLESVYPGTGENIIELGNEPVKYVAFTKYIAPTFKLALVDNEVDINNPEKHVNILINNSGELALNKDYMSYEQFDNADKTAKYVGSILIISQSYVDELTTRPVYLTGWCIYGLAPYAPSWSDYAVMNKLNGAAQQLSAKTTNINLVDNKKVYYLELVNGNNSLGSAPTEYNITVQYKNKLDNLTNIYNVNGPVQRGFANTSGYIFLDEPIIASLLTINTAFANTASVSMNVYGVNASQKDENLFKLEQGKYDPQGMIIEGQKCPNVGQMMQKQLQAQQICEALEQKDRIRNKKASYERDKAYLKKLAEQDGELKQLANKITGLIEKKNTRIRESNISGDAQKLDAELEKIQAIRREAEEYMKTPNVAALDINVNLEPDLDLDYIKKNINV